MFVPDKGKRDLTVWSLVFRSAHWAATRFQIPMHDKIDAQALGRENVASLMLLHILFS